MKLQFGDEVEKKKEEKAPEPNISIKPSYNQTQKKQCYNKNQYNKNQYHNNNNYNNYNNNSNYNHGNNNYNNNETKDASKTFQNKFDQTTQQQVPSYHNPFMMPQMMPMNMNMNMYQHQQPIEDDNEKSVSECLEYYFSEENLNKDYYIRSRMNDDGYIDAYEIVNFNNGRTEVLMLKRFRI
jgi:la-related protein 1